jgi:hypothetical protein
MWATCEQWFTDKFKSDIKFISNIHRRSIFAGSLFRNGAVSSELVQDRKDFRNLN